MKLSEIIEMFHPIQNIAKMILPPCKARKVAAIRRKITEESQFYADEEYKLKKQYAIKDMSGNVVVKDGKISFDNFEIMQGYLDSIKVLDNLEIQFDFEPLTLLDSEISGISGEDVDNLRHVITFGGD